MIGRTTEDQMHIGIYWGYVAMMEGLVERMKAEIGRPVTIVATGGLATLFDTAYRPVRRDRGRSHHPGPGDAPCPDRRLSPRGHSGESWSLFLVRNVFEITAFAGMTLRASP